MITVVGFRYENGTQPYLKQGVKNHYTPRGAVGGGNGSFIMPGDPPKVILGLKDGEDLGPFNCYSIIKDHSSRRMSAKYAYGVCFPLVGQSFADRQALIAALIANIQ